MTVCSDWVSARAVEVQLKTKLPEQTQKFWIQAELEGQAEQVRVILKSSSENSHRLTDSI